MMVAMSTAVDLDVVRQPREYDQSLFVNRQGELRTIGEKMRQAQTGDVIAEPVVNFWGVGGIGKTWLLNHLYYLYRYPAEPTTQPRLLERPTFALYYTFSDKVTAVSLPTLTKSLARETMSQLSPVLSTKVRDILVQAENTGKIELVVNALADLSRRFVPLILLDNTEKIAPADWAKVEQQLIEPLVSTNHALVVVAGRRQVPRWRRFEVRRRVMQPNQTQVRAFDKSGVTKQITQRDYHIPVDLIYPFTAGNPHLVDAIAQNILSWTKGAEPDQATIDQYQDGLLQILRAYEDQLLDHVPAELRPVLNIISPLRFYRMESLRSMLTKQEPGVTPQPDLYYLNILRALDQQTEVVWWDRERRAYATNEIVRQVINRRWLLADSENYAVQHRQVVELYWGWARDYPEASEDLVLEIWFHLANLYLVHRNPARLRSEIDEAFDFAQAYLTSDRLLILLKQLEGDHELLDLLPDDLQAHLVQALEQSLDNK